MAGLYDGDASTTEAQRAAAASNAVLAGIAAADAVCCAVLGQQNVGGHEGAVPLLKNVRGADKAAGALKRLIDIKSRVQYLGQASAEDLRRAQRAAKTVLDFAEGLV